MNNRQDIELLSPDETAALLGVRVQTLSLWRCTRRYNLPYVRVGRLIRYKRADVENFIRSRTVAPVAETAN